jgi:hypothetical protein
MISSTLKIAAALPIRPIFEVFSRKCGVSETTDAGIAMQSFFLSKLAAHPAFLKDSIVHFV